MQVIAPVTPADLLHKGQRPLLKFEILYCCCWVDLTPYVIKGSLSVSTAGAEMTPNPVAGQWSVALNNKGGRFDPDEPGYAPYNEYFKVGRKVKISVGARYSGIDYYWRRIYGFMELPSFSIHKSEVSLSGFDNTQFLTDTKLKEPTNYWGDLAIEDSVATTEYGAELYDPSIGVPGAGDAAESDAGEGNRVAPFWAVLTVGDATITSEVDIGGFSDFEIEFRSSPVVVPGTGRVGYAGVCDVVAGTKYNVTFKYARIAGDANLWINLWDGATLVGGSGIKNPSTNGVFHTGSFSFTAPANGTLDLRLNSRIGRGDAATTWRVDNISIKSVTTVIEKYQMPDECNGIHYVELDEGEGFLPVWPGQQIDGDEGWFYDPDVQQLYFAEGKIVDAGTANLKIHYYTEQIPEEVVADLLARAGLYDNQAEALAAMLYTPTSITIGKVWFKAGSNCLNAVKMLCERCNYRFYFNYGQRPVFKPAPSSEITIGSLNYDNLVGTFLEGEIVTGGTSGITGRIDSDDGSTLELIRCSGCFNDDEEITGGISGATADVNHPDGAVGVDEHVKNGAFVHNISPPNDWTAHGGATLTTEVGGQVGNRLMVTAPGGGWGGGKQQTVALTIGRTYGLSVYFKKGTAVSGQIYLGTSDAGNQIWNSGIITDTDFTLYTHTFVATSANCHIMLISNTANLTAYYDEVTLYDLSGEDFSFLESHITNIRDREDRNEIRNRIIILGNEQALPEGAEETKPSKFKGEASEVASINKYGEHTMSITNHLFQDQASVDAYCAIYLAAFKDPKWYTTFDAPFNPVPLEQGDTVTWRKKYEAGSTPIDQRGILRDIQINEFNITYTMAKVV